MILRRSIQAGLGLAVLGLSLSAGAALTAEKLVGPATYTTDGKLNLPPDYRTWVYLSSGLDMAYTEDAGGPAAGSVFDNVFVDREAYAGFQRTGHWPDGTVMVLELRGAQGAGSINKRGRFQAGEPRAAEVHVRDTARFKATGGWAFFGFRGDKAPASMIPGDTKAGCYTCHRDHAAVDTTFVQFYPTLLPRAQAMGTLSAAYLADEKTAAPAPHP